MAALHSNPPPSSLFIPSEARGPVRRRLVVSNPLADEVLLLKLVLPRGEKGAVSLSEHSVRLAAGQTAQILLTVETGRLPFSGQQLRGYVRPLPSTEKEKELWLRAGAESRRQLAFVLKIASSAAFSALDTVVWLPGRATLVESKMFGRLGVDDRGCEDALDMDVDCLTARGFCSMEDLVEEMRRKKADSCWLLEKILGGGMSRKKGLRDDSLRSQYLEPGMNDAVGVPL